MPTQDQSTQSRDAATLKEKFQQHMDKAKQRIEKAKQDIANLREQDKESIRQTRDALQRRIEAQQQRGEQIRDQVDAWLNEKKQHTDEQVASWRQKRELKHLEKRADRAAEYAVNVVAVAMMDADEAEAAVLDAIDARLDADTATA